MYNMTNVFACDEPPLSENGDSECFPRAILTCKGKSSFRERNLNLCQPVKIGRAVGKFRPTSANGVFDCKVLSRNHALLFYEKNKFFLQDTGSSNGTFVNNVRLSNSNENSLPKEVFSGDLVQFGVDVTESTKYVTIPCIAASVRLFHPDGTEAKAVEVGLNSNVKHCNTLELTGWLQEARQREEALRNKLVTLSAILHKAQASSEQSWKSMVEEDILLSRIESLQTRLKSLLETDQNRPDEVIVHLWKEVMHLQEEKERYEAKAKDAIQKVLQEKLMVISKNYELQVALSSSEEQRDHYKNACDSLLEEMKKLAEEHDKQFKELQEMQEKYKVLAEAFENISSDLKSSVKPESESKEETEVKPKENGIDESHQAKQNGRNPGESICSISEDKYSTVIKKSHSKTELYRPNPPTARLPRRTSYSQKFFMEDNKKEDTIQDLIQSLGYKTRASSVNDSSVSNPDEILNEFKEAIQKHIQPSPTSLTSSSDSRQSSVGLNVSPEDQTTTENECVTDDISFKLNDSLGHLNDQQSDSDCCTFEESELTITNSLESTFNASQETIVDANYPEKDEQSLSADSFLADETLNEFKEAIQKHIQSSTTSLKSSPDSRQSIVGLNVSPEDHTITEDDCVTDDISFKLNDSKGHINNQQSDSDCCTFEESESTFTNSLESTFNPSQTANVDTNHPEKDKQSLREDSSVANEILISNETILEAPITESTTTTNTTVTTPSVSTITTIMMIPVIIIISGSWITMIGWFLIILILIFHSFF